MKKTFLCVLALIMLFGVSGCGRTFEVRFDTNGGTLMEGTLLQKVSKGADAVPPVIEREGYKFVGWDPEPTNILSDVIIVPKWIKMCHVTFDPNGGELESGELVQEVEKGKEATAPILKEREDYTFTWDPADLVIEQDTSFTAIWNHIELTSKELYERIKPSVVEITIYDSDGDPESVGTGFFIDDNGTVLTNYHVMEGAYRAKITLDGGKTYDVRAVLDYSPDLDLALVETDISHSDPLPLATTAPDTGDDVYAIGSSRTMTNTFTHGMVTTASRVLDDVEYVQHDAPISPGNSGGPLVNRFGEVLGINTMSLKDSQNINFAVSISHFTTLDERNRMPIEDFYKTTNADYLWGERVKAFIEPASATEQESNNSWRSSDRLTMGEWTAGAITDEQDVDCFYVVVTEPGRVTFELVPNHTNEAEELIGIVGLYNDDNDIDVYGSLSETDSYSYKVELVYVFDAPEAGLYCIGITHDDDYEISEPYVYLVRAT